MPIDVLPGAERDIEQLEATDPDALAAVLTFLDEAESDSQFEQKLTTVGDVQFEAVRVSIKRWARVQRTSNLLRVRILDTPATVYRVIYGYDWRRRRIGILAIVHKDHCNYDPQSELSRRILDDWNVATDGQPT